jgi:tRNA pseudouridine55 synthase
MSRAPTLQIDGVILLDKPEGLGSNAALQRTKRLFNAAKAGHTGTLDPFATGLLPLCLGEATKFAQGLLDADKAYLATARLGVATDTADRDGRVIAERPFRVDRAAIEAALATLTGPIDQVPPMYSALKQGGRPLYEIARAGGEVPRAARRVTIHELTLVDWTPPMLTFSVRCSKGTYVRTLAEQIAGRLDTVAHLTALRRTAVGPFDLARARTPEALQVADPDALRHALLPVDTLVLSLPGLMLAPGDADAVLQGRALRLSGGAFRPESPAMVRLYAPGRAGAPSAARPDAVSGDPVWLASGEPAADGICTFVGVGELTADGGLRPVRLIAHSSGPGGALAPANSPNPVETS